MNLLLITSFLVYIFGLFNLLGINPVYFKNQLIWGIISIGIYLLVKKVGIHFFRLNSKFFYWIFLGILIITFVIGMEAKGSKRWIDLYFFSFQGSEFFKFFFMIFLADYFTRNKKFLHDLSFFIKSLIYFLIPTFIIFKQPDLGSAIIYVMIFFSMALFSGIPKKNILKTLMIFMLVIPVGWIFLKGYQKERIISFLNPNVDQSGMAYNMIQAIVTIGSGMFSGKGLGAGTQSGLSFLPESHTDFAFSSLVEQFGFVGGFAVIVLYLIITVIIIRKILTWYYQRNEDGKFKFLLSIGFFSYFIIQVFVNIGMNLGIMPITGITLPLISYGGSSLITWVMLIALMP